MSIFDDDFTSILEEKSKKPIVPSAAVSEQMSAIQTRTSIDDGGIFDTYSDDNYEENDFQAARTRNSLEANPALRNAAKRFLNDRLGVTDVDDEDVMDEFVEHFRKFNVNEMTAAGDFNYVSGLAADATGKTDLDAKRRDLAKQRLADYRLLYTSFQDLPSFHGGGWETFGDYAEGIMTAPSTYVGLLLPGAGKAGGVAATQAAKAATQSVLMSALSKVAPTRALALAAANPVKTAAGVEAVAGSLQDIAAQKTELEADLRDDYNIGQTLLTGAVSGALPAAVGLYGLKGGVKQVAERNTGDLLGDAEKSIIARNEKAEEAADKILKENDVVAKDLSSILSSLDPKKAKKGKAVDEKKPLDPEQVQAGKEQFEELSEEAGITPDFILSFDESRNKRIFGAVVELVKDGKIDIDLSDPNKRVTEYVADAVRKLAKDEPEEAEKIFKGLTDKYNITGDDFANLFMADISDAARKLGQAGAASRIFSRLNGVAGDDIFNLSTQTKELILKATEDIKKGDTRSALDMLGVADKEQAKKSGINLMEGLRKADELRRSAMTSQTATTIRNTASGVSRVGIDLVTKGLDRGIARSIHGLTNGKFGYKTGFTDTPNEDIFAVAVGMINTKETAAIEEMFKRGFAQKSTQLFREMQDVIDSAIPDSARTSKLRALGRQLNALNTASDNVFKRAAFVGNLKRGLNEQYAKGIRDGKTLNKDDFNLRNIVRDGKFNDVFNTKQGKQVLDTAIDEALYFTYQRTPDNSTAKAMINLAHSAPFLTTSLVPFPRFIANALRFTYEYSPLYLLQGSFKSLVKDENNYEEVSKALVGTAGLYGALAFRDSEYAGEKWYEGKLPDGSTFDMRPFFPAAPYLWAADMMKRHRDGDPIMGETSFFTEGLQALSGTQFRAGFGIYAIDKAVEDMANAKDSTEALKRIGVNMAANIVNTYSIPITAGQDLYNTFLSEDEERLVRDNKITDLTSLFLNRSLARVPMNFRLQKFLAESMGTTAPEIYQTPTRAGVLRRTTPLTRQFSGILKNERRNWFEKELEKIKVSKKIIGRKTGVPEADAILNQHFGEYIEDYVTPILQNSKDYEKMTALEKRNMMVNVISRYKQDIEQFARRKAKLQKQNLKSKYGFNPLEVADFKKYSKFARDKAFTRYHEVNGKPESTTDYNYDELIYYAKYYDEVGKLSKKEMYD